MNLGEALPEYIQDDDLWGRFMRPKVDVVMPALDEFEVGDHAGMVVMGEPEPEVEPEVDVSTEATDDGEQVEVVSSVDSAMSAWRPSRGKRRLGLGGDRKIES